MANVFTGLAVTAMYSCAVDVTGNVYVSQNDNIYTLTYPLLNVASNFIGGLTSGNTDGYGSHASFSGIFAMTFDSNQTYLYVSDNNNNAVRRVNVSTNATSWRVFVYYPYGIVIDSTNENLYVGSNYVVLLKIVISTKTVSQYAGSYSYGKSVNI